MNPQWSDEVKERYIKDQAFYAECTARGIQICTDVNTLKWAVRNDCPHCEYNKKRAQNWRVEAYRLAGHPLPEREWVGLTDEEFENYWDWEDFQTGAGRSTIFEMVRDIEAKLKEKNT